MLCSLEKMTIRATMLKMVELLSIVNPCEIPSLECFIKRTETCIILKSLNCFDFFVSSPLLLSKIDTLNLYSVHKRNPNYVVLS